MRALIALSITSAVIFSSALGWSGQKDVEERLTCQCGCGLTVHTCNHLQCGFAIPVRTDITESLANGDTEDGIVERYVGKYGEKILSAPTRKGFNLLAWYGPYLAILLAGTAIVVTMRKWTRRSRGLAAQRTPLQATPTSPDDRDRLTRELEDLDT